MSTQPSEQQWLDQVRTEWDSRATAFDEMSTRNATGEDRRLELDFIWQALELATGTRLLDAGCGSGQFAIAFAERGCLVDGVDLSPEMIERARANATNAGVDMTFSVGDLAHLNAPDASYDAIVARMVLQFSPRLSAVLDEFERVAMPNARLWLSVPGALSPIYRESWQRFVDPEPRSLTYLLPWELTRLLEERGWSLHEQWGSFDTVPVREGAGSNVAAGLDTGALPLPLQQAAATVWNVIAVMDA